MPKSPFPKEHFDDRIRELEAEVAEARAAYEGVQEELAWWRQGRELFNKRATGGTEPEPDRSTAMDRPPTPSRERPTLREAILQVIREQDGAVTNEELLESLRQHGWLPSGKTALHNVRARVARMSRDGELERVGRGTYRLPSVEPTPDVEPLGDDVDRTAGPSPTLAHPFGEAREDEANETQPFSFAGPPTAPFAAQADNDTDRSAEP